MNKVKKVVLGVILGALVLTTAVVALATGENNKPNGDPDEPIFTAVQTTYMA